MWCFSIDLFSFNSKPFDDCLNLPQKLAWCGEAGLQSQPVEANAGRAGVTFHHIINSGPVPHETSSKKNNKQISKWEIRAWGCSSVVICLAHCNRREEGKEGGRRKRRGEEEEEETKEEGKLPILKT